MIKIDYKKSLFIKIIWIMILKMLATETVEQIFHNIDGPALMPIMYVSKHWNNYVSQKFIKFWSTDQVKIISELSEIDQDKYYEWLISIGVDIFGALIESNKCHSLIDEKIMGIDLEKLKKYYFDDFDFSTMKTQTIEYLTKNFCVIVDLSMVTNCINNDNVDLLNWLKNNTINISLHKKIFSLKDKDNIYAQKRFKKWNVKNLDPNLGTSDAINYLLDNFASLNTNSLNSLIDYFRGELRTWNNVFLEQGKNFIFALNKNKKYIPLLRNELNAFKVSNTYMKNIPNILLQYGTVDSILTYLDDKGVPKNFCEKIKYVDDLIKYGNLEILKWICKNGFKKSRISIEHFVVNANLEMLEWFINQKPKIKILPKHINGDILLSKPQVFTHLMRGNEKNKRIKFRRRK